MSNATAMFALSFDQIINTIMVGGADRSAVIEGHMGTGKSSMLKELAKRFPDHVPCYFDCTTKNDAGDLMLPNFKEMEDGAGYVRFVTNEELGAHLGKPVIILVDEIGKNPAIINPLTRLLLERTIGMYRLHPESVIFCTMNLGAENVGDMLKPHVWNRVTKLTMRKPTALEWIEWGLYNGIDHTVLGWVRDNEHVLDSFENVRDPEENPYIYHPRSNRKSFVTPRSLEAASDWIKKRDRLDRQSLTATLMGTIGDRGGLDLMTHIDLADQLPSRTSIEKDPKNAKVPTSAAAVCMVVFRVLQTIDPSWAPQWFEYMERLDSEAQGMFINGVRNEKFNEKKRAELMKLREFTKWAVKFNWLYSAEKV